MCDVMDKAREMTIQDAHYALVRPLHILRGTPVETLCEVYRLLNGREIEKERMRVHASLIDQMYVMLVNDFNDRYGTGPGWPEKNWGYAQEETGSQTGNRRNL